MWRRYNNNTRAPEPEFIEPTMDDGYLETIPEVASLYSSSRPVSTVAALPELPFRAVAPLRDNDPIYRQSVSSVYSQPSPTFPREESAVPVRSPQAPPDVSPMSTPRTSGNFAASDTSLVSPIESSSNLPQRPHQSDKQPKSSLPRPINLPRPHPAQAQKQSQEETKWDDYSGEPTTADSGKPPQARPGAQQGVEMQYPQLKERTKQILAGLRDRGAATQKAWGRAPPPVAADPLDHPPSPKEPWRGASGREAIVAPVKNNAAARAEPLKQPRRNVNKMDSARDGARTASPDVSQEPSPDLPSSQFSQRTYATQPKLRTSPRPDLSIRVVPSQEEIKPTAPLKFKSPRVRSPTEAENLESAHSPFHNPRPSQAGVTKDVVAEQGNANRSQPMPNLAEKVQQRTNHTDFNPNSSQLPHEPVSHMGWTTYATTTNESPDSLRASNLDSSPVPPLPSISSPLILRKRPISTATNNLPFSNPDAAGSRASIISRKPVPSDRRSSSNMFANSKSLPPTPIEKQAGDKITTLEARLNDLAMRRRNNSKLIYEMQEDLKRNVIAYGTGKRMNVEKQITNLEQDLSDIAREEHEVGLQLHRAQRKRDREDCYENPTGLWIKRVTT